LIAGILGVPGVAALIIFKLFMWFSELGNLI
jgi:hypothetical protein